MSKILVTGSTGFIGKRLVKNLKKYKYDVIELNSEKGDISDLDLSSVYKYDDISHIFHLASATYVPLSWEKPSLFYKSSVIGTNNVLELCRKKESTFTYVSAYLYGEPKKLPISEDHILQPNNPYAHSKFLAEELCRFYSEFYDLKVVIARPFNIYGENQKTNFLIPKIIDQVINSDKISVMDLYPKRDFLYVDDLVDGLVKTIDVKNKFSIYNFGSGVSHSVKEIIKIIQKVAKTDKTIISNNVKRKNEINNVVADISKAKNELNWQPRYSLEQGIENIIKHLCF